MSHFDRWRSSAGLAPGYTCLDGACACTPPQASLGRAPTGAAHRISLKVNLSWNPSTCRQPHSAKSRARLALADAASGRLYRRADQMFPAAPKLPSSGFLRRRPPKMLGRPPQAVRKRAWGDKGGRWGRPSWGARTGALRAVSEGQAPRALSWLPRVGRARLFLRGPRHKAPGRSRMRSIVEGLTK